MSRSSALFTVLLIASVSTCPVGATVHKYTEDFSADTYKDAALTTAWWDTGSGELKLYPFEYTLTGTYNTPDAAQGIAVWGNYAYVADEESGLQVIDISDPYNPPTLAGSYDTPDRAYHVAVSGDYAFVADWGTGLIVLDISDPTTPTLAGTYNTTGNAIHVCISGDYAYVADYSSGLQVIDISDPTTPALAGNYDTPGSASGVFVSGDYAYVADDDYGLQVIDISDPTNPVLAGSYDTSGEARGVWVEGNYAYVADYAPGLKVIDISDPASPTLAGSYNTSGYARRLEVSGNRVYIADSSAGLQVVDISNPTAPSLITTYNTPGYSYDVTIAGESAFLADGNSGLQIVGIADPTDPTLVGGTNGPNVSGSVDVDGDYAYVADNISGLRVVDVSDPSNPTLITTYSSTHAVYVAVSGDHAYVADYFSGLLAIDISNPAAPSLAGGCSTPGTSRAVAVSGDYAYVANYDYGLRVIDISDPTGPAEVGSYDTPGYAMAVAVSGDYAYVGDHDYGLQVIDISDPTAPTLAGNYDSPGYVWGVAISGDYAYIGDAEAGFRVVDITDPENPVIAGNYPTDGEAHGVFVSGDFAFVADNTEGLHMIDITQSNSPIRFASYDTPGNCYGVCVSGQYAYVTDYNSGLHVIQVFQSDFRFWDNYARSLQVNDGSEPIVQFRLTTTETGRISWMMSANGFHSSSNVVYPDGSWNTANLSGTELTWYAKLKWETPGVNPTISDMEIEWLSECPYVDSVVDVPDDQGGRVRLHLSRSAYDFADGTDPVVSYTVWRQIEDEAAIAALSAAEPGAGSPRPGAGLLSSFPARKIGDRLFVESDRELQAAGFPSGTWEAVGSFNAIQQDRYLFTADTYADSSATVPYTAFCVTAHSEDPLTWWTSPVDSGYSVDNIAPGVPLGLSAAYNTGSGNHLLWDPSPEPDFQYYRIYRGEIEGFVPGPGNLVYETAAPEWTDPEYDGWDVYYKVTALDHTGNESGAASPVTVTGDDSPMAPKALVLYQNAPNPFNPTTTIRFDLPHAVHVKLCVYNVKGELVATLADQHMTEGRKEIPWTARNDQERAVSSGIFFYRLVAGDFVETRKMVLLR